MCEVGLSVLYLRCKRNVSGLSMYGVCVDVCCVYMGCLDESVC